MSCYVCNLQDSLTCSKCFSNHFISKTSKLKTLQDQIRMKKLSLISILNRLPQDKLNSLQLSYTLKQKKSVLEVQNKVLEQVIKTYKQKKTELKTKQDEMIETSLTCTSSENLDSAIRSLEKLRRNLIERAIEIYERNIYFPEYCVSEMLVLEKVLKHGQGIKVKTGNDSVDKLNLTVSFKNMSVEFQSDEHNQALNYSIHQICFCINLIAQILNISLPFPLEYKFSFFQVKGLHGNRLVIDALSSCEFGKALVYVCEDLKILQKHCGVDFSRVRGLLDVVSIGQSESCGKVFELPYELRLIERKSDESESELESIDEDY